MNDFDPFNTEFNPNVDHITADRQGLAILGKLEEGATMQGEDPEIDRTIAVNQPKLIANLERYKSYKDARGERLFDYEAEARHVDAQLSEEQIAREAERLTQLDDETFNSYLEENGDTENYARTQSLLRDKAAYRDDYILRELLKKSGYTEDQIDSGAAEPHMRKRLGADEESSEPTLGAYSRWGLDKINQIDRRKEIATSANHAARDGFLSLTDNVDTFEKKLAEMHNDLTDTERTDLRRIRTLKREQMQKDFASVTPTVKKVFNTISALNGLPTKFDDEVDAPLASEAEALTELAKLEPEDFRKAVAMMAQTAEAHGQDVDSFMSRWAKNLTRGVSNTVGKAKRSLITQPESKVQLRKAESAANGKDPDEFIVERFDAEGNSKGFSFAPRKSGHRSLFDTLTKPTNVNTPEGSEKFLNSQISRSHPNESIKVLTSQSDKNRALKSFEIKQRETIYATQLEDWREVVASVDSDNVFVNEVVFGLTRSLPEMAALATGFGGMALVTASKYEENMARVRRERDPSQWKKYQNASYFAALTHTALGRGQLATATKKFPNNGAIMKELAKRLGTEVLQESAQDLTFSATVEVFEALGADIESFELTKEVKNTFQRIPQTTLAVAPLVLLGLGGRVAMEKLDQKTMENILRDEAVLGAYGFDEKQIQAVKEMELPFAADFVQANSNVFTDQTVESDLVNIDVKFSDVDSGVNVAPTPDGGFSITDGKGGSAVARTVEEAAEAARNLDPDIGAKFEAGAAKKKRSEVFATEDGQGIVSDLKGTPLYHGSNRIFDQLESNNRDRRGGKNIHVYASGDLRGARGAVKPDKIDTNSLFFEPDDNDFSTPDAEGASELLGELQDALDGGAILFNDGESKQVTIKEMLAEYAEFGGDATFSLSSPRNRIIDIKAEGEVLDLTSGNKSDFPVSLVEVLQSERKWTPWNKGSGQNVYAHEKSQALQDWMVDNDVAAVRVPESFETSSDGTSYILNPDFIKSEKSTQLHGVAGKRVKRRPVAVFEPAPAGLDGTPNGFERAPAGLDDTPATTVKANHPDLTADEVLGDTTANSGLGTFLQLPKLGKSGTKLDWKEGLPARPAVGDNKAPILARARYGVQSVALQRVFPSNSLDKIHAKEQNKLKGVETQFNDAAVLVDKALKTEANKAPSIQMVETAARLQKNAYKAIRGDDKALKALPKSIRKNVVVARESIDFYAQAAIDTGALADKVVEAVGNRMGSYIFRQFKVYDAKEGWSYNHVKENKPDIYSAAYDEIRAEYPKLTPKEVDNEIRELLSDGKAQDFYTGKSHGGRISVTSFIKRQDLSQAMLDLLGEVTNPAINIRETGKKVAGIVINHNSQLQMAQSLRENGLSSGKKNIELGHTHRLGAENVQVRTVDKDGKEKTITVERTSAKFSGLKDTWVSPFIGEPIDAAFEPSKEKGLTGIEVVARMAAGATATGKYAQVIWNPASYPTNFIGGVATEVFNGRISFNGRGARAYLGNERFRTADRDAQLAYGAIEEQAFLDSKASDIKGGVNSIPLVAITSELKQGGLLDNNVIAGDLKAAHEATIGEHLGGMKDLFAKAYQVPDNRIKHSAYIHELNKYMKAFPDKTMRELSQLALKDTRATTQNYDMVPKLIKSLSSHGALIPTYVSYTSELIRNTTNTAILGIRELSSGNIHLQIAGGKRIAGMIATSVALKYAYGQLSEFMTGLSEEALEKLNARLEPWLKDSGVVYLKGENGNIRYFDPEYVVPQALFYNAIANGVEEFKNGNIVGGFLTPLKHIGEEFTQMNILSKVSAQLVTNVDDNGQEIYNPENDDRYDRMAKLAKHAYDNMLTPGVLRTGDKIKKAVSGEVGYGGSISTWGDLSFNILGIRPYQKDITTDEFVVDPMKSYVFRKSDISKALSKSRIAKLKEKGGDALAREQAKVDKANLKLEEDFIAEIESLKVLEVIPNSRIREAMTKARVPKSLRRSVSHLLE